MSDAYVECLVKAKGSMLLKFLQIGLIVITAIFGFIGITFMIWPVLLIAVATGVGAYFAYMNSDIEYEYLYLDKEITIDNLYLTDNVNTLNKYKLPNTTIDKESYLLIYLSGESKTTDKSIYANFKLSEGEELILSDGKNIIDKVKIIELKENISYGKQEDSWYYFTSPTPGKINNTKAFSTLGGQDERT